MKRANRKRLTPKERVALWVAQAGLCGCGCRQRLNDRGKGDVGEHVWHFVALGNDEKPDALYRKDCARKKTNGPRGDLNTIAHVKRLRDKRTQADKRKLTGAKLFSNRRILSRGFDKLISKRMDGTVVRRGR